MERTYAFRDSAKDTFCNVMIGTNQAVADALFNREFNPIVWASDNIETVAHYYEGYAVELQVRMIPEQRMEYCSSKADLENLPGEPTDYTYGFATMSCPANAIWYSFSSRYLKENMVSAREIFPDLSKYNDDSE